MLPDWQIELLLWPTKPEASKVVFVPRLRADEFGHIQKDQVQPASLDVRLGPDFILHPSGTPLHPKQHFMLFPGDCVLASLVERFNMPDNVVARVEGKSTWARKFLTIHSAGFIDPGFYGDITLELKNDGQYELELIPGQTIAQVSFQALDAPARRPYGTPGLNSHYQGQTGATPARG